MLRRTVLLISAVWLWWAGATVTAQLPTDRLLRSLKPTADVNDFANLLAPADRAVVATLADFAFYCGTGHHTAMGMGQTRKGEGGRRKDEG